MEKRQLFAAVVAIVCTVSAMTAFYASSDPATITKNLMASGFPHWVAEFVSTLPSWLFQTRLWVFLTVGAVLLALWPRAYAFKRAGGSPAYWSLTQAISWLGFGQAITSEQWKQEYPQEVLGLTPNEERRAFAKAEKALLEGLQDSSSLIAYGRMGGGSGDHVAIPETYFLRERAASILDDTLYVKMKSHLDHMADHRSPKWFDVRLKRSDVLRSWPTPLPGHPLARTPRKLKTVLVRTSSPGLRAGEHRPHSVHGCELHYFIGIENCSDETVDDVSVKATCLAYGEGPSVFPMNKPLPTSDGLSRVNIHPRARVECSLLTQIDKLDADNKQVTLVAFGGTALSTGPTKIEISISGKTQPVFTEAFRIDFDGRAVNISRWDEQKGLA